MATSTTPFEYTVGERVYLSLGVTPAGTADIDFTVHDITINLDSEDGATRHTFEWRPLSGTSIDPDDVFELIDDELFFSLPSAWTAENITPGCWTFSVSAFDQETVQDEIALTYLNFKQRPGGPLPTTGG